MNMPAELERALLEGAPVDDAVSSDVIPPDPALLVRALRQIGYSIEQAVADLVDNSVSAGARTILVRFFAHGERIVGLAVADDGVGMTDVRLREAMRFGSEAELAPRRLGKFGMGLKLASLSHARALAVCSRRAGRAAGRRWTVEGVEQGWKCERLAMEEVDALLDSAWSELDLSRQGTLVVWDEIDRLPTSTRGLRETLRQLHRRLQLHLGMCFHRFLQSGRVRILIDLQRSGEPEQLHRVEIDALNPFGYSQSGHPGYPKHFRVELASGRELAAVAHVWPANSEDPAYRLGNRAAARQGFYFYRHDRLIQAGGWNGLLQHESEPHGSLARVAIDLPEGVDDEFGLNVQKSVVVVPPDFVAGVLASRAADGSGFEDFRRAAHEVYRGLDVRAERQVPLVPAGGLPKALAAFAHDRLASESGDARGVDFVWSDLDDPDKVFTIERETRRVLLNQYHRHALLGGQPASGTDAPLLKLCLFFLFQEEFDRERVRSHRQQRLDEINALLLEVVRAAKVRAS